MAEQTTINDPAGGQKAWWFATTGNEIGLLKAAESRLRAGVSQGGERRDFTWSWNAGGAYIASIVTTADVGTTGQVQKRVTQVVSDWGNVTQAQTFDYGNLNTPVRTYAMTYLENANYTSRYIRNRPLSASVNGTVVVTHSYDTESPIDRGGLTYHDSSYGTSYIYRGNATVTAGPPAGQVTTIYEITGVAAQSYDALWRGVSTTPSASTNYSLPGTLTVEGNTSLTTTIGYNSAFQVTSVSGANSNDTATTEYDTAGRPSASTTADGYDPVPANRHSTTYAYTATTQTATLGTRWKRTTIDGFGRVSKVEAGHETTTESVVETEYAPCGCSPLGKVKRVSQPHAPGAAAKWTVYTYDGLGRTLTVTAADGSVTTYAYAGASVTVVDAAGKWKRSYTDALGNLVRVEEPNPAGGANYQTTYTYTTLNQLSVVTMPRPVGSNTVTQTRTFTYSGSQVESATNPENGMVQYTYNDARQVVRRVDAKGQETTYEYDAAGRLTTVRHYPVQWQEDTGQRVSYTYDTQSLVPGYTDNGTGRKMQVNQGSGYWFDIDVGYTYDNEGRVTALAHPDGSNYSYTFDAMGRLSGMSGAGTANATYGVAGQLTGLSYLGVTETRVYNDVLQMTRLTAASGGSNVVDMEYVYAAGRNNGRITQAWDHVSGEQVNYTYDSLNRLATAVTADNTNVAQWGLQFSYDGFGNLNGQTVVKGSAPTGAVAVEAATNRVIGETYDANGNPVGVWQGVAARVFDVENRMVFDNDNGIRYGYDDQGKRVLRGSEVYVWGVDGKRLATYQQGAFNQDCQCVFYGWVASNVYFGGKLVKTAGTVVVTDRLGSVRWKGNGETYHYHPYGQQYAGDSTASKLDGKEKFGTYFRDADGKDYADQRYFSQGAGRFLTPDPGDAGDLNDPQSLNLYSYVGNDPINFNDPEGTTVNIPLGDGGSPTSCLNYKLEPWMHSHGFSVDDNFGDFGNTAVGTLGITLYYESTGGSTQLYQQMAQVMANRYWLANSNSKLAGQLGLPVWGSSQRTKDSRVNYIVTHTSQDWDSKGNLSASKQRDLTNLLDYEVVGKANAVGAAACDHFISALNVAYDAMRTIFANQGAHYSGTYLDTYWFFQGRNDPVNHNYWNTTTYGYQGWNFERYISPKVPKK